MTDDLSLDRETIDAQTEVCAGRGPERVLSCGHTRQTHETRMALCKRCGAVREVMTPASMLAEAAREERGARLNEELAINARIRARQWRDRAAVSS